MLQVQFQQWKKMKINKFILFIILFQISCTSKPKGDDIVVYFHTTDFENSVGISCSQIMHEMSDAEVDTIIWVDKTIFTNLSEVLESCPTTMRKQSIDCRICMLHKGRYFFMNHRMYDLVVDQNEKVIDINPKIIYDIKCWLSYFNHFSVEDLKYDTSIDNYGFPDNYHYINKQGQTKEEVIDGPNEVKTENSTVKNKKITRKVILRLKE